MTKSSTDTLVLDGFVLIHESMPIYCDWLIDHGRDPEAEFWKWVCERNFWPNTDSDQCALANEVNINGVPHTPPVQYGIPKQLMQYMEPDGTCGLLNHCLYFNTVQKAFEELLKAWLKVHHSP